MVIKPLTSNIFLMGYDVYLKRLTPQELGYRRKRLMTGQYFYISKSAVGNFFKELSRVVINDSLTLEFNDPLEEANIIEATYVYHNDKFSRPDGTRNEYRIYLNRDIAKHDLHFQPNDIIAFIKKGDNNFHIDHYRVRNSNYNTLSSFIDSSEIRGAHALLDLLSYKNILNS
jgi:hypothetical protein